MTNSIYVPRGIDIPPLDTKKTWEFTPASHVKVGSMLSGGDIYGMVYENGLFPEHKIMVPPKAKGRVKYIAERGDYTINDKVLTLEYDGKDSDYTMAHEWAVR